VLSPERDSSRDKWLTDPDVMAIAKCVVETGEQHLVRWCNEATITDTTGSVDDEFRIADGGRLLRAARLISEAGARIVNRGPGDGGHLRGAVLELVVAELIRGRSALVTAEVPVVLHHLNPPGCTNPIEVVVDDDPVEAYECKAHPRSIRQDDLEQLDQVRQSSNAIGRNAVVAVATFGSRYALERAVASLTIPAAIRHLCQADLLEVGDAPPKRRLAKDMSGSHRT